MKKDRKLVENKWENCFQMLCKEMRLFTCVFFVLINVSCNDDEIIKNEEKLEVKTENVDMALFTKLAEDDVFKRICNRFEELKTEFFNVSDSCVKKNIKELDYFSYGVRKYAERYGCENLVPYILYYNQNQQVISRCDKNRNYHFEEKWQLTWNYYEEYYVYQLFQRCSEYDIPNINHDICTYLNTKPTFFCSTLFSIIVDYYATAGSNDYIYWSCSEIEHYCNTIGIYAYNGWPDEITPTIEDIYEGLYEYYVGGNWRKYLSETPEEPEYFNRCPICGSIGFDCSCGLGCSVCRHFPCICRPDMIPLPRLEIYGKVYNVMCDYFMNDWPRFLSQCDYISSEFFGVPWLASWDWRDGSLSYPILMGEDLCIEEFDPSSYYVANNSVYVYSYDENWYRSMSMEKEKVIDINDIFLLKKILATGLVNAYFIRAEHLSRVYVLVTLDTGKKIDKSEDELQVIYDEEYAKIVFHNGLSKEEIDIYTIAAVLRKACPHVLLLCYNEVHEYIDGSCKHILSMYDVEECEYNEVTYPFHYKIANGGVYIYSYCQNYFVQE